MNIPENLGASMFLISIMILAEVNLINSAIRFDGKKVLCREYNKDLLQNVSCSIKLKNRYTQLYSMHIVARPEIIIYNLKLKMTSYYKFRTEFRPTGIKLEEDACEFLRNMNSTLLLSRKLFKNIPEDIFKPCPLSGTRSVDKFELTFHHLPPVIPTGEYHFDTEGYTTINGKEIFLVKVQNFFVCSEIFSQ